MDMTIPSSAEELKPVLLFSPIGSRLESNVSIPSFLTMLIVSWIVPSLPIISDPELLLRIHHLRESGTGLGSAEPKCFTNEYRMLLYTGDLELNYHSINVLLDLFGPANRSIVKAIADNWVANKNWSSLALLYGLHDYVNWIPHSWKGCLIPLDCSQKIDIPSKKHLDAQPKKHSLLSRIQVKYWGDLWEAWWGAVCYERNLWGETNDDLDDMLRFWFRKKYRHLIREFSMLSQRPSITSGHSSAYAPENVNVESITRKHTLLCDILGHPEDENSKDILGYKASIPELNISVFHPTKREEAIDDVLRLANGGTEYVDYYSVDAIRAEKDDLARPFTRAREEGRIRQMIWDVLATEMLNVDRTPGQLPTDVLCSTYTRLRQLRRKFISREHDLYKPVLDDPSRTKMKSCVLFFWAEVNAFSILPFISLYLTNASREVGVGNSPQRIQCFSKFSCLLYILCDFCEEYQAI